MTPLDGQSGGQGGDGGEAPREINMSESMRESAQVSQAEQAARNSEIMRALDD